MTTLRNTLVLMVIFVFLTFTSCKETPTNNEPVTPSGSSAVFVLCEGNWGFDNSVLTRYDQKSGTVIEDYFSASNPGLRIGDNAGNMAVYGGKCFISVSTAKTIEAIDLKTGKSLGRLVLDGERQPRKICIVNDSVGYVTDLGKHSVIRFDTRNMTILKEVKVGPAPEGIVYSGGQLFVANSGYGDFMKDSLDAGTIYVIDEPSMQLITKLKPGPNVYELLINKTRNKLYAQYFHLFSMTDSIGGIVEYDLLTLKSVGIWRDKFTSYGRKTALSVTGDTLYYLNDKGIAMINLNTGAQIKDYVVNPVPDDGWYCLSASPSDGSLWVGNAKNYQVAGEVIVYKLSAMPVKDKSISTGIIPNTIEFY